MLSVSLTAPSGSRLYMGFWNLVTSSMTAASCGMNGGEHYKGSKKRPSSKKTVLTRSSLEKFTCSGGSLTNVDIPTSMVMSWLRYGPM